MSNIIMGIGLMKKKLLPLHKLGTRPEGYGIGLLLGKFIYECWVSGIVPCLDLDHIYSVGQDVYRGIFEKVLELANKYGEDLSCIDIEVKNAPHETEEAFLQLVEKIKLNGDL